MCFPGGLVSKESACNVGDLGSVLGLGRSPGEGNGNPLQYSCLENPHGQRNLVGYSPWGLKELDTAERLSRARCICTHALSPLIPSLFSPMLVHKSVLYVCLSTAAL